MTQITAILCIGIYGMLISYLLAMKHEIAQQTKIDDAKAGSLFSAFMIVGAVTVMFLSPLIDVFGHKCLAAVGFLLLGICGVLLSRARSYPIVVAVYAITAIGGMTIISTGNTLLPLVLFDGQNAPASVNLGNVFYGVGAFAGSLSLGFVLKKAGIQGTSLLFAALFALPLLCVVGAEFPELKSGFSLALASTVFSNKFFWIAILANFFAAGAENGICAWLNTSLVRRGVTDRGASQVLSFFFVGIMVSRLISVTFVTPTNTGFAIAGNAVVATFVTALLMMKCSKKMAIALFILSGLVVGPNCPNIFGYLFNHIDPRLHGTAFGFCFAAGLLGASVSPGLVGVLSKRTNLNRGFAVNVVFAVGLLLAAIIIQVVV
jgi:fucose permease